MESSMLKDQSQGASEQQYKCRERAHAENKEEQLKNRKKEVQCMAHPLVPF